MVNVNAIAQSMVESVVVAEDGSVTSVNFDVLDKAIADVRSLRKELNEQFKESAKEAKKLANEEAGKSATSHEHFFRYIHATGNFINVILA